MLSICGHHPDSESLLVVDGRESSLELPDLAGLAFFVPSQLVELGDLVRTRAAIATAARTVGAAIVQLEPVDRGIHKV